MFEELADKIEEYKKHKIIAIGSGRDNPFPAHYGMEEAMDILGGECFRKDDQQLIEKISQIEPEFVIVMDNLPQVEMRRFSRVLKVLKYGRERFRGKKAISPAKTGWWFWDLRHPVALSFDSRWFNAIFLCNKALISGWERVYKIPTYYMPQASTPTIKNPRPEEKIDWDIVFVGNVDNNQGWHEGRKDAVDYLRQFYKVEVRNGILRQQKIKISQQSYWLYEKSPFCLVSSTNVEGYNSNRLYNVLAYKGFALVRYFKGIEKLFDNHTHLVWFKTLPEAKKWIEYYYRHPQKYYAIKEAGHRLFLKKHTHLHRVINMLDILSEKSEEFYGYKD